MKLHWGGPILGAWDGISELAGPLPVAKEVDFGEGVQLCFPFLSISISSESLLLELLLVLEWNLMWTPPVLDLADLACRGWSNGNNTSSHSTPQKLHASEYLS